jgi:hypothetical protein
MAPYRDGGGHESRKERKKDNAETQRALRFAEFRNRQPVPEYSFGEEPTPYDLKSST